MRIDPRLLPTAPAAAIRPTSSSSSGPRFALAGSGENAPAASARSAAPLATLDAILALQGEADPRERRRRAAARGADLLDELDRLKATLLGGGATERSLRAVTERLAGMGPSGDPRLDSVLSEIDLRARVELAKFGRAPV